MDYGQSAQLIKEKTFEHEMLRVLHDVIHEKPKVI